MAALSETSLLSSLLTKFKLAAEENLSSTGGSNSHAKLLALCHELTLAVESPMETVQRIIYQVAFLRAVSLKLIGDVLSRTDVSYSPNRMPL